jgi:hypothetical protein
MGIAPSFDNLAIGATNHRMTAVQALQKVTAPDLYQGDGCHHGSSSSNFCENPPIALSLLADFALM